MSKRKGQKPRTRTQIERDRKRISELYLKGWLQAEIAEELHLSQPTVSNDLKAIQKEWLKSTLQDFDKLKARELAKIDNLELVYWEAWERSKDNKKSKTIKLNPRRGQTRATNENITEIKTKDEDLIGDPRFLSGVQWCIDRRCKLLGIDAPEKHELSGTVKTPRTFKEWLEFEETQKSKQ